MPLWTAVLSSVASFCLIMGLWSRARDASLRILRRLERSGRRGGPVRGLDILSEALELPRRRLGRRLAGFFGSSGAAEIRERLVQADMSGILEEMDVMCLKLLGAVALGCLVAVGCVIRGTDLAVVPVCAGVLVGFKAPDLWLDAIIRRRRREIVRAFPWLVDLLVLCADAGMSLSAGLQLVAARVGGPLGKELARADQELKAGRRTQDALLGMVARIGLPEIDSFVSALLRAHALGTPVSATLRSQAAFARQQRKQAIEARIGTLPVKMTLCTIIFFLPLMLIIVVLPHVLTFVRSRW